MKRILLLLLPLLALPALGQPSPGVPPTRIIAGSGIAVTTNGFNNFTIATGAGTLGTNNLNANQFEAGTTNVNIKSGALTTNLNVKATAGNALTINTNALVVDTNNVSMAGTLTLSAETASTIASLDANKAVKSLDTGTYPSLAELTYVKGGTSSFQTQINNIQSGIGTSNGLGTNTVLKATLGTTNWGLRVYGSNHTSSMYVNEDAKVGAAMFGSSAINALSYGSLSIYSGSTVDSIGGRYWYATGNGGTPYVLGVSTWLLTWSSSSSNPDATDTAITRNAANGLELHSGTPGVANRGTWTAAKYTGRAGTSTQTFNAGGPIYSSITAVGNVGAGEDDLISTTVAGNTLAANGDRLRITGIIVAANTINAKRIRFYWDGTAEYTSTMAAVLVGDFTFTILVTRTGAATQNITIQLVSNDATETYKTSFQTGTATLSGAIVAKFTGEAVDNDDLIQKEVLIEYLPAP